MRKKFGVFIKPLDIEINTDDGFRPFSTDSYEINWIDEDAVNVRYNYGNEDVWKSEIITLKWSNIEMEKNNKLDRKKFISNSLIEIIIKMKRIISLKDN